MFAVFSLFCRNFIEISSQKDTFEVTFKVRAGWLLLGYSRRYFYTQRSSITCSNMFLLGIIMLYSSTAANMLPENWYFDPYSREFWGKSLCTRYASIIRCYFLNFLVSWWLNEIFTVFSLFCSKFLEISSTFEDYFLETATVR